jgi:uncharacterized protein (TIGR03089 family)
MQITTTPRPTGPGRTHDAAARIAQAFGPRPAISVYGTDDDGVGSRREISGAVLANWAFKTANYFTEELDMAAGERLDVDCRWGWRPVAVALGAWAAGLVIATDSNEPGQRHLASDSETALREHVEHSTAFEWTIAIPVEDLAQTWGEFANAPETWVDYAAHVSGFGDQFQPFEPVTGTELALPEGLASGRGPVLLERRSGDAAMTGLDIATVTALLASGRGVVIVTDPGADLDGIAAAEKAEPISV